jgi:hypothetical protein
MTENKKPPTTIVTNAIVRLAPRSVTVLVRHRNLIQNKTTVNINITPKVYEILLKNIAKPTFPDDLPLIFFINSANKAFHVMPLEMYEEQKAKQAEEKSDDQNPQTRNP